MENIIAIIVIFLVVSFAFGYIIRAKKKGQKCIGCPYSGTCSKKSGENASSCSCGGFADNEK